MPPNQESRRCAAHLSKSLLLWCFILISFLPAVSEAQSDSFVIDDFSGEGLGLIQAGAAKAVPHPDGFGKLNASLANTSRKFEGVALARTVVRATVDTRGDSRPEAAVLILEGGRAAPGRPPLLDRIEAENKNTTAAKILSVKRNEAGDLKAFLSSLAFNSVMAVSFLVAFGVLRAKFPLVYSGMANASKQEEMSGGVFGWVPASLKSHTEDSPSLDAEMAIRWHGYVVQATAMVGIPMCLVMCPLHLWCGGMPPERVDSLSRVGMANIRPGSWLYWVHAVVLCLVVVVVERAVYHAMDDFLKRRFQWLKGMPEPRSTTVMVENIPSGPQGHCSDEALQAYFRQLVPEGAIKQVHVVRRTDILLQQKARLESAELMLRQAVSAQHAGESRSCCGVVRAEQAEHYRKEMAQARAKMAEERARLLDADPKDEDAYTTTAFVTFEKQQYREIALRLQFTSHADEFVMSIPPEPSDIRWGDLKGDAPKQVLMERLGYLCALGLYIGFMPITVTISSVTNLEYIRNQYPAVDRLLTQLPWLETGLDGILASFALTLFLSFLPTIFMIIFDKFFVLRAGAWAQHKLQNWYFWFQIVFVLLVTVVGSSVIIAFKDIAEKPFAIFGILADSLPEATHFYLSFMAMQWVTHAMNITRYITLVKYLAFLPVLGERRAKELSEPEDQDYYGFGSRSARWTCHTVIVLTFCQLSPAIALVGLADAFLCRLVYGYLLVYAEDPKPDLGGVFFVQQLVHLQKGMFVYAALMVGVLLRRSASFGPVILGVCAMAYMAHMYVGFHIRFGCWETLPFEEIADEVNHPKRATSRNSYVQPELDTSLDDIALDK